MKDVVTSYLNRRVDWQELGYTRIRICRWVVHESQRERYDTTLPELYPTEEMIRNFDELYETREDWILDYKAKILDKLDPQEFYDSLPDKCVLMCHEKSDDEGDVECHRIIVSGWLEHNLGVKVPEWLTPEQLEQKETKKRLEDHIDSLLDF